MLLQPVSLFFREEGKVHKGGLDGDAGDSFPAEPVGGAEVVEGLLERKASATIEVGRLS